MQVSDAFVYSVVANLEGQYSIWPANMKIPDGWTAQGVEGSKEECLNHIEEVWTDMRPRSLLRQLEKYQKPTPVNRVAEEPVLETASPLVRRLCSGPSPVEFVSYSGNTREALREQMEMGHIHVRFAGPRGDADLRLTLRPGTDSPSHDPGGQGQKSIQLVGEAVVDFVKLRCTVILQLENLRGTATCEKVLPA
jgi:MbtH protein